MDILGIGFWELILIFIVAMMVFGPRRLPEYAAKAGKIVRDLRNMSQGLMAEWQREITVAARLEELQEVRKELELTRQELNQSQQQIGQQTQEDLKQAQKDISTIKKQVTSATPNSPSATKAKESDSTVTPSAEDTGEVEATGQKRAQEKPMSPDSKQASASFEQSPEDVVTPPETVSDAATKPEPVEVNGQNNTSSSEAAGSTETAAKPSKPPLEPKETIND